MREALERQRKFVSKVEKRTKAVIPWVFCRPDGVRIHRFASRGVTPARPLVFRVSRTTSVGLRSGTWNVLAFPGRRRWP
jgi:hypothetical protein